MSEFTVDSQKLSEALNLVLNSSEVKTTIPWLAYILIDAQDGRLKLSGTDMDMSISIGIDAEVKTPGAFCVKAKQISSLVALISGDVSITVKADQVWLKTERAKYRLPYLSKDEFRFIEAAQDEKLNISGELLSGMIRAASIAMETNPNGKDAWKNLELRAKDGKFTIAGMCGPRASITSIPCKGEFYLMLPAKGVNALAAFAANSATVSLCVSENLMTARCGENEATFKLSALKWADWSVIAKAECEHQIEIDSEGFVPALKRVLLASDRNRLVSRVDFRLQKERADLFSESANGEGNENLSLTCPTLNGDSLPIAIDGAQLLDLFRVIKGRVVWEFSQKHTALRFTPKEPLPFEFAYVQGTLRV